MKLKKWLATALAVVMAVGTLGALAACGEKKDPSNPNPNTPNGDDDTATQYYLVGSGLGTLAVSNWDQTSTDESLKFTRSGNTATITAELYEGDLFQVIHNQDWAGQMGMNIVANGGKDADDTVIFEEGDGYDIKNIKVAAGQSGKYELTVTLNSESDYSANSLTWKLVEKYDVVFATWYDLDKTTVIAKTVIKKGTTTTARAYETNKRFYEFDKWMTKTGDTAFDFTQSITANIEVYATIKESNNTNYVEDTSPWKIKSTSGTVLATLAPDEDYEKHNVFTGTYEMEDGAEFVITNGTIANAKITGLDSLRLFAYTAEKYTTNAGAGGNYKFTLITEKVGNEWKVVELFAEKIASTYSGYAVVGTLPDADWAYKEGINPKMVETGANTGIYKATLVVSEIPTSGKFEIKVATISKGAIDWDADDWGVTKKGDNVEITTADIYTVTLDTNTDTLTVEVAENEYYVVGGFTTDWAYVEGTNPKLTETGAGTGIFTGTLTLTADTEVKVAVVIGGAIRWSVRPDWGMPKEGDSCLGGANVALTAGTYTVTLNTNTNVLTFTPVTA